MERCYSRVKSRIKELRFSKKNDDILEPETAQASDIEFYQKREDYYLEHDARSKDDDIQGFSSENILNCSAPIPASERLDHIGSWPAWKCLLDSRRREAGSLDMSWVLERVPDSTPFQSMRNVEQVMDALESSYQNCIFEGHHRSQHTTSVLYHTTLDKIAKFGCCTRCEIVAATLKPGSPGVEPYYSRSKKVVVWCADWGALEANVTNEAVVEKALEDGTFFLMIGGHEASFQKFWLATIQSDHYWSFARNMLDTCRQLHECCRSDRRGASPHTPRRLISIGSHQEDLRLIETDERNGGLPNTYTYAALSYCWGNSGKNYKTTMRNLSKHKIRLPWGNLPPTITDAIYVCKSLYIPYLWVDAICIIQGDQKDWEEQSGKMRDVFSHCVVALAAEDTEDCDLGFLPRVLSQHKGRIPCSGNQDQVLRTWSSVWGSKSKPKALSARGWTLQEQILPCRKLRFTSSGMVWECNQDLAAADEAKGRNLWSLTSRAIRLATSDRGSTTIPAFLDTSNNRSGDHEDLAHRNTVEFITSGSSKAMHYAWYSIAEDYSSRALTNPADKLVALSGLASLLATSIAEGDDDYLAGHWKRDLAEGLLWHTVQPCRRYLTYIAPSWSWASMDGKISFFRERNQFPFHSHIEIEEAACEKSPLDPTGRVSGGYIRLTGDVVPVHVHVAESSSPGLRNFVSRYPGWGGHFGRAYEDQLVFVYPFGTPKSQHWEVLCDKRMSLTTECTLEGHCKRDSEHSAKSESRPPFFCLSIGRMSHYSTLLEIDKFRHWWLLLEALPPGKHVYKRIGIGYYHRSTPDLFDLAVTQAVTIV